MKYILLCHFLNFITTTILLGRHLDRKIYCYCCRALKVILLGFFLFWYLLYFLNVSFKNCKSSHVYKQLVFSNIYVVSCNKTLIFNFFLFTPLGMVLKSVKFYPAINFDTCTFTSTIASY